MFTAELNAQMDELEALLAATAGDNNDNATQNGLVAEIDKLEALIAAPVRNVNATHICSMIIAYNIMGIFPLRNVLTT